MPRIKYYKYLILGIFSIFKKPLQEARLSPMHVHGIMNSAPTVLLSMRINAKVVQEILGHANISTILGFFGYTLPRYEMP